MSIRSRLLLFLLPTMVGGTIFISSIFTYHWYNEILDGFKTRIKSAVVSCAFNIDPHEIQLQESDTLTLKTSNPKMIYLYENFNAIKKELDITNLYVVYIDPKSPNYGGPSFLEAKDLHHLKKIDFDKHHVPINPHLLMQNKDIHKNTTYIPFAKDVFTTSIYKAEGTFTKIITGYAPIKDTNGIILAYIAADVSVDLIDKKLQEGLTIIILSAGIIIALMIFSLFFIADKIAAPVQKLNNSALSIAAGQYGERIDLHGPKEIVELASTLNTMSECLHENINQLKENSLLKEKLYGEYECAMFLQNHMLKKVIDECQSDAIAVKAITFFSSDPHGFLLNFPEGETENNLQIHLIEAKDKGFEGMYQLLTKYKIFKDNPTKRLDKKFPSLILSIDKESHHIHTQANKFNLPFVWSQKNKRALDHSNLLEAGDLFFICNSGLFNLFQSTEALSALLTKVLKYFSEDGLETCVSMLQKEISLIIKKKNLEDDLHLLCFQMLL